ncbi:Glyoxylase, beta-lactamase superfamily II [Kytococcus aerolatus]|uniref:Glyoxylase, beta-lactamase superfamily II n=1 Tax=Kytococcus aerolatus TaxID=592308 RepID=A0A212U6E7_9MICO|nr:MBL fold metallo-hydrolase [Kytococcus aerolatus]SNC73835.1 Glyoxylase, beta-lactamase superfamily II [Kytococcus aerolatus]
MRSTRSHLPDGGEWATSRISERAYCLLCPNPSPMTLDGTNTWLLREPASDEVVVVDPGPLDHAHLRAIVSTVESWGARVGLTLLTHGHEDHAAGADEFHRLTGAPVRRARRAGGDDDLGAGDVVRAGGLELLVVETPGHTSDSLSFVLPAENRLLTGDTVLGRGSTVVAHPDGDLEAYLGSLERIERLTASGEVTSLLPGHGPFVADAAGVVAWYREHRAQRLEQVAVAAAAVTPGVGEDLADAVVRTVYADVPREVWPAARLTVLAQLEYLRTHG